MQSRVLFAILLQIAIEVLSATVTFAGLDMTAPLTVDRGTEFFDSTGTHFGPFSYAGDINGDSIDDFIVGASGATFSGRSGCGMVYVIFGEEGGFPAKFDLASELSSSKGFRIIGASAGNQLGAAMSYAGDVNNDGISDIIVGAPQADPSTSYIISGAAYIIFGKQGVRSDIDVSSLDSSDGFTIYGPNSHASVGSTISNAGDINRDKIDDIMVIVSGTAYVIFGGGTSDVDLGAFTSSQGFKIINGGLSASSVAGDFNNDGIDDIVVASGSAGSAQNGMAWIIYGQSSGLTSNIDLSVSLTSGVQITGPSGSYLGSSGTGIAAAGDINGDGIDDVILGGPFMESSSIATPNWAGIAYIIYGKAGGMSAIDLNTNLDPSQGFYILGSGQNGNLGTSVGGGFDANGDGIDDFVVGAPQDRPLSRLGAGAAFVIYGKSSSANIDTNVPLVDSQGFELQGGTGDALGTVTRAGDVNNDGSNDILVAGGGNVYLLYSAPGTKSGKDKLSPVANIFSDIVTAGVFIQAAVEPSSSNGIVIGSLSKIFEYTRYYDVSRSSNLELFYQTHRRVPATIVISPGLSNDTIEEFHGDNLAHPFITHGLYSSYVVNFFKSLMTLLILLGIVLLVAGIEVIINKRLSKFSKYAKMGRLAVINYLITQYYNVFGDIFFFGALDYMTLAPEGAVDWISFFLGILFYLFGVLVLFLHVRVLRHYQARKPKKATTEENIQRFQEFKQRHENVELLYKDFKDFSFLHQSYLLWITIRLSICALTMTVLYAHPIAQAIINIVENIAILLYIWRKMLFQSRFSLIQQVAFEIDLLLVNICFLVSAGLDYHGTNSDKSRYPLGQIIIIGIFVSKFFGFITLVPTAIDHVRDFLKKQAEKKKITKPTKDTPKEDKVVELELEPVTPRELVLETDAGLIQEKPKKSKRGSEISNASEYDLEELDDTAQASPVMQSTVRQYSMLPLQSPKRFPTTLPES